MRAKYYKTEGNSYSPNSMFCSCKKIVSPVFIALEMKFPYREGFTPRLIRLISDIRSWDPRVLVGYHVMKLWDEDNL